MFLDFSDLCRCMFASAFDGSATFGETSPCRGFVHFDSVFFTAQALGFTGLCPRWPYITLQINIASDILTS